MELTPEARALAQVLLAHHRRLPRVVSTSETDRDSCLIGYAELCERAGLPHLTPTVGKFLREIAGWCYKNGWPPLNSLAVNHQTRTPGRGYDGAPGCSLANWPNEVAACLSFRGYPTQLEWQY